MQCIHCKSRRVILEIITKKRKPVYRRPHMCTPSLYYLCIVSVKNYIYVFTGDVRGSGLLFGLEVVWNKQSKKPAKEIAEQIVNRLVSLVL